MIIILACNTLSEGKGKLKSASTTKKNIKEGCLYCVGHPCWPVSLKSTTKYLFRVHYTLSLPYLRWWYCYLCGSCFELFSCHMKRFPQEAWVVIAYSTFSSVGSKQMVESLADGHQLSWIKSSWIWWYTWPDSDLKCISYPFHKTWEVLPVLIFTNM